MTNRLIAAGVRVSERIQDRTPDEHTDDGGGLFLVEINMLMTSCPHTVRSELGLLLLIRAVLTCAPLKQYPNYRERLSQRSITPLWERTHLGFPDEQHVCRRSGFFQLEIPEIGIVPRERSSRSVSCVRARGDSCSLA